MLIGTISLDTGCGPSDIPVELLGNGPRPGTVWIKALDGRRPFTKMSHGGPYQDHTIVLPKSLVRNVSLVDCPVLAESQPGGRSP